MVSEVKVQIVIVSINSDFSPIKTPDLSLRGLCRGLLNILPGSVAQGFDNEGRRLEEANIPNAHL